jgi:hypothetical protein
VTIHAIKQNERIIWTKSFLTEQKLHFIDDKFKYKEKVGRQFATIPDIQKIHWVQEI